LSLVERHAARPLRIAVLASGSGTNLQAIIDRFASSEEVAIVAVGSNRLDARALERAHKAGIGTTVFARADYEDRVARDAALGEWLAELDVELVVLAGYMELLSVDLVRRFAGRMINVHPALLPSFPGLDAIGQALEHGVRVTGVTVHFVDEGVDTGPILLQQPIELTYTRSKQEIEAEVHEIEHELLPRAIELIAAGAVRFDPDHPRIVRIDERTERQTAD